MPSETPRVVRDTHMGLADMTKDLEVTCALLLQWLQLVVKQGIHRHWKQHLVSLLRKLNSAPVLLLQPMESQQHLQTAPPLLGLRCTASGGNNYLQDAFMLPWLAEMSTGLSSGTSLLWGVLGWGWADTLVSQHLYGLRPRDLIRDLYGITVDWKSTCAYAVS